MSCASRFFLIRSKFFTEPDGELLFSHCISILRSIDSISSCIFRICRSEETLIFAKLLCAMMTASQSPIATLETNCSLWSLSKSSLVAIRSFAVGYRSLNWFAHCCTKWFGTAIIGFFASPYCLNFIQAAQIVNVFPLPTIWCKSVFPLVIMRCTASFWCGRSSIAGFISGNFR